MIRREERRLHRAFRHALWIALATPLGSCAVESKEAAGEPATDPATESAAEPIGEASSEAKSCAPVGFTPNPPDTCGNYVRLPCGLPASVKPGNNCYLWLNDCKKICPGHYFNCRAVDDSCKSGEIVPNAHGAVEIDCSTCAKGVGRIPEGLAREAMPRAPSPLGDYFAAVSHLEAASVIAFDRLHGELAALGAPARILRAARRARRDEIRHARLTARMARRFGGRPPLVRVPRVAPRALDAVAIENAVEGCVRETFGALVASFQAVHAADPEIARLMSTIARDEARHAALSWAIAKWARSRLDAEARARLDERAREAVAQLYREATAVDGALATHAGLPNAAQHRALVRALEEKLWKGAPRSVSA